MHADLCPVLWKSSKADIEFLGSLLTAFCCVLQHARRRVDLKAFMHCMADGDAM